MTFLLVISLLIITTFAKTKGHNSSCFSQQLFFTILHVWLKRLLDFLHHCIYETSSLVGLAAFSLCLIKDHMQQGVIELKHYCVYVWNITIKPSFIESATLTLTGVSLMQALERLIGFLILNFLC